ncbi:MAG: dihydroorotase, partial [Deltaproteobacteria bacterium]|nr:dihydroorotase [Deltaproteobacteria bacterium]
MDRILLKNGRVLCPETGIDDTLDIIIMGGRIASIRKDADIESEGQSGEVDWSVIDCKSKLVLPGLIDLHVHLREPGEEYKETVLSGASAAVAGGFTTVACMANTNPVNDNEGITKQIIEKAAAAGKARVLPIGAVTKGLKGAELSEMGELKQAGCVGFSDDGKPIKDGAIMRSALEYALALDGAPVISHAEDPCIVGSGVMNESATSTRLGLAGIPNAAEDAMVARDIALSEASHGRLHIAHVSTRGAVELIRAAKKRGVNVTAEATPHHLFLSDTVVKGYDTDAKMNPPLRSDEDIKALRKALKDGTIDCIATDHAPHSSIEKDVEFDCAAFGVVGLETALALTLKLVDEKVLTLNEAISRLTRDPARIFNIAGGSLKLGGTADITIVDLKKKWT